jgi:site-specific DNA-methyltransferase (adenine-specific)
MMANYQIHQGNNVDTLRQYEDGHFDAIITDPPYGIEFLGKDWDSNTGAVETWQECFRVLKPGGYLLAFSAARTYHHLASNIESVGFEIRDQLMWLCASGFPKAQDIGKAIQRRLGVEQSIPITKHEAQQGYSVKKPGASVHGPKDDTDAGYSGRITECTSPEAIKWSGWKTHLKPAHEPIVMARKPFKGSCIDNVLTHGVGALNIDDNRIAFEDQKDKDSARGFAHPNIERTGSPRFQDQMTESHNQNYTPTTGRFPSNVMGEVTGYQKFFYCPKVSRRERHVGYEQTNIPTNPEGLLDIDKGAYIGTKRQQVNSVGNNHPTVKPVALMRYLIKLVTPPNSKVLDPFTGSGSTGMAAVELGHRFVGCELDPHYVEIAKRRIQGWCKPQDNSTYTELFEDE